MNNKKNHESLLLPPKIRRKYMYTKGKEKRKHLQNICTLQQNIIHTNSDPLEYIQDVVNTSIPYTLLTAMEGKFKYDLKDMVYTERVDRKETDILLIYKILLKVERKMVYLTITVCSIKVEYLRNELLLMITVN